MNKYIVVLLSLVAMFLLMSGCSLIPNQNPTQQYSGNCARLHNKLGAPFAYTGNSEDALEELRRDMESCYQDAYDKVYGHK